MRALVLLALLAASPAAEAARRAPAAEEPDREAAPTLEERKAVFGEIDTAFLSGNKATAADLLVEVVRDPDRARFHAEAWARLGGALEALQLPYAALVAYERALATDAEAVSSVAKGAIRLADQVGDTALLEEVFARNVGLDVDPATRSRMAYLAAREAHHQGRPGTALAILRMVRENDPFRPEAKALEGVLLSLQGRHEAALKPLLEAERLGRLAGRDERFLDVVRLNLARAYYGAGNFGKAIEYYARVRRESPYWLEAQFERAWAHFRLDDMAGAIALLHNHTSPFLRDRYYPEALLLRVHALFLLCRFPEATRQIDDFTALYQPRKEALDELAGWPPERLWTEVANEVEGRESALPPWFLERWLHDDRFRDDLAAVRHAEDEIARLRNAAAHPFTQAAADWLEQRRSDIVREEGRRVAARVERMRAELDRMLADAELSKLDMLEFETRLYQRASVAGAPVEARRTVQRAVRVRPGQRYWPWEGEWWADELGYYRVTAKSICPPELTVEGGG